MIRHLTTKANYNNIISDKVIRTRKKDGRDRGVISFEKYNENDVFVEIFRDGKEVKDKVVGIFIDDEELDKAGFNIYYTDSSSLKSRQDSKYTTKYENVTRFSKGELDENYIKIGEYVHIEGEIPIRFIKKIQIY